jgi:hypothetical protein
MGKIAKRKCTNAGERDARDAQKLYRQIKTMPALKGSDVEKIESAAMNPKNHMWRRAALGILAMPPGELFRKIETDREAAVLFAEAAQGIREYLAVERELLRVVDSAQIRVEIGLCKRDDYEEIFVDAKVERKASKRLSRPNRAGAAHG